MESGNPPRHSKPADEPVTIDLAAEDVTPAANSTEAPAETLDVSAEAETATPELSETSEQTEAAAEPWKSASAETPSEPQHAPAASPVTAERASGTSGLVAAGIVGGLVALAAVGAMQYAGYWPGGSSSATSANETTALSDEIERLKQQIAALPSATVADPALETRLAALEAAAGNPATASADGAAVSALEEKIAALTAETGQLKADLAKSEQSRTTTDGEIARRIDEAEKKLNEPRDDVAMARAIAVAALKAATDRGGPFLTELDTLAGVAADDPIVADLKGFATTGVLSRAELVRQFPDTATAILEAINQPAAGEGLTDRLMASAMSLVKVRPVGNIEGESPEAIVARMEEKLKNGDLKGAALEWNSLPDAGKAASTAFKTSLDDRIRVEDLVGTALTKAVSGTDKQG